jgi:hypothetical protein
MAGALALAVNTRTAASRKQRKTRRRISGEALRVADLSAR